VYVHESKQGGLGKKNEKVKNRGAGAAEREINNEKRRDEVTMPMRTNPSTARETQGGPASYMSRTSIPSHASPSSSSSCSRLLLCVFVLSLCLSLSPLSVCLRRVHRKKGKNKLSEGGNKDGQKNKNNKLDCPKGKFPSLQF
jgi:hypothetical protein